MKIIPPKIDATLKSIKRTLHEKPALIPLTPDAPAAFEGSLQPGHAITEAAKFIQKRASNVTNRNIDRASVIFRSYASGFLVHRLLNPFGFAAGQLAVFQGASEAPISGSIRAERATRKNSSQLAAAQGVALK